MGPEKYVELETRASFLEAKKLDLVSKLEARARVRDEIELMKAEGKALTLTDEEIQLLDSFRRFRLRMRKNVELFTWQTHQVKCVQIVEETSLVVHPDEGLYD